MFSSTSKKLAITPRWTMRGHTGWVDGIVHLPGERRIISCSHDASLRLWDLESGTQIGGDWRDESKAGMWSMALSPNNKTVASGSSDRTVSLWNVETRKNITKWTGHTRVVCTLCWSSDGKQVVSGSRDGTARVWDVDSGETVMTIKTRHKWVNAVIYSPDNEKIASGGDNENAVKIWDSKIGELITALKHDWAVWSLAWTSDGKKLISGSYCSIRIFDTATWQQIAVLEGHTDGVNVISLSRNNRLLASVSRDNTARLWNLDTNLLIGQPLQHEDHLHSAALSDDGKVLVTSCKNGNMYTWDIHAIIKQAGLEDLLPVPDVIELIDTDATQAEGDELPPDFFDDMRDGVHSSTAYSNRYRSSARRRPLAHSSRNTLFRGLSTLFRRSPFNINQATELQQRPRRSIFSHGGPHVVKVAAVRDKQALYVAPPQVKKTQAQPQGQVQSSSSQSQPAAASTSTAPPASAPAPAPDTQPNGNTIPSARPAHSLPLRMLAHLVLFLCCASSQHDGNVQPTQQQQGQSQNQVPSLQTQPAASSTSTTPTAPDTHTTTPGAATAQPRPLPLRTRFVLFLCCASLPHADGH
ncbi:WD40-repeat-containing domain protein [Suillus clintonianus]|uniref:WD40-repeat-containing domain protein n=1 Tax=Suillus clintonianus TaxID=1904413 RepID=UPI001B8729B9|nr:WD40-repeat-containing domain protein [Suillus clintonianus]KAG2125812.1 WD40-repeat-containing domain protein [Suillus clintonianus]